MSLSSASRTVGAKSDWHRRHDLPWLVVFVIPAFIIVVAVQFYPLAYSAVLSVQDWVLTESQTPKGFVGLENFAKELGDDTFRRSVRNSVYITGGALVLQMTLGHLPGLLDYGIELAHAGDPHAADSTHGDRAGGRRHTCGGSCLTRAPGWSIIC